MPFVQKIKLGQMPNFIDFAITKLLGPVTVAELSKA
jgi:hypothetical protein